MVALAVGENGSVCRGESSEGLARTSREQSAFKVKAKCNIRKNFQKNFRGEIAKLAKRGRL